MPQKSAKRERQNIPVAEWVAGAIGLVLTLGMLGVMLVASVKSENAPPVIVLSVDTIVAAQTSYVVVLRARNEGDKTASATEILGTLTDAAGHEVERSNVTVDYLPPKSVRGLGLFFKNDPRSFKLSVRAVGYEVP